MKKGVLLVCIFCMVILLIMLIKISSVLAEETPADIIKSQLKIDRVVIPSNSVFNKETNQLILQTSTNQVTIKINDKIKSLIVSGDKILINDQPLLYVSGQVPLMLESLGQDLHLQTKFLDGTLTSLGNSINIISEQEKTFLDISDGIKIKTGDIEVKGTSGKSNIEFATSEISVFGKSTIKIGGKTYTLSKDISFIRLDKKTNTLYLYKVYVNNLNNEELPLEDKILTAGEESKLIEEPTKMKIVYVDDIKAMKERADAKKSLFPAIAEMVNIQASANYADNPRGGTTSSSSGGANVNVGVGQTNLIGGVKQESETETGESGTTANSALQTSLQTQFELNPSSEGKELILKTGYTKKTTTTRPAEEEKEPETTENSNKIYFNAKYTPNSATGASLLTSQTTTPTTQYVNGEEIAGYEKESSITTGGKIFFLTPSLTYSNIEASFAGHPDLKSIKEKLSAELQAQQKINLGKTNNLIVSGAIKTNDLSPDDWKKATSGSENSLNQIIGEKTISMETNIGNGNLIKTNSGPIVGKISVGGQMSWLTPKEIEEQSKVFSTSVKIDLPIADRLIRTLPIKLNNDRGADNGGSIGDFSEIQPTSIYVSYCVNQIGTNKPTKTLNCGIILPLNLGGYSRIIKEKS